MRNARCGVRAPLWMDSVLWEPNGMLTGIANIRAVGGDSRKKALYPWLVPKLPLWESHLLMKLCFDTPVTSAKHGSVQNTAVASAASAKQRFADTCPTGGWSSGNRSETLSAARQGCGNPLRNHLLPRTENRARWDARARRDLDSREGDFPIVNFVTVLVPCVPLLSGELYFPFSNRLSWFILTVLFRYGAGLFVFQVAFPLFFVPGLTLANGFQIPVRSIRLWTN